MLEGGRALLADGTVAEYELNQGSRALVPQGHIEEEG